MKLEYVNHESTKARLHYHGIDYPSVKFSKSYVNRVKQKVCFNYLVSSLEVIVNGVRMQDLFYFIGLKYGKQQTWKIIPLRNKLYLNCCEYTF